jgi:hypothetical protein
MAFGFNPFTGNFDLTGGGDAAPFAGQVDAYADLPLDTTAALNSRWLVKNNSGTWPFSTYKQAGIYIRVSTVGASRDTDYQFVGTLPSVMNDNEFLVYDDTDATKNLKFNVGANVPTASTVTLTAPSASGTLGFLQSVSSITVSSDQQLTAARNQRVLVNSTNSGSGSVVYLPNTGNAEGDRLEVACVGLTSGTLSVRTGPFDFTVATSMVLNEQRTFIYTSGAWTVGTVESHGHAGLGPTFASSAFQVTEPSGIATNRLAFSLSGITAGSTRTLTVPDASGRIQVEGQPIGNVAAAAGSFTTLSASDELTASNATASPPTTLAATKGVQWLLPSNGYAAIAGIYPGGPAISVLTGSPGGMTEQARFSGSGLTVNSAVNIPDGSRTALPFRFTSETNNGFYRRAANTLTFVNGGSNRFEISGTQVRLEVNQSLNWVSNDLTGSADLTFVRDAADTLGQRRAANPQRYNLYGQFTSTTNFERLFLDYNATALAFRIGTEKGTSGSARPLELQTDGVTRMTIAASGALTVAGTTSTFGVSNPAADTTIEMFGAGAANRLHKIIAAAGAGIVFQTGTTVPSGPCMQIGGNLRLAANSFIRWSNNANSSSAGGDSIELARDADDTLAMRRGANAQTFRLYNTVSGTNNVNFERANFRWASSEFIIDAEFGGTGTALRGIKIGSATSSLLGFYGVTPVDQPATVADPAGGGTVDTEARTAINAIIDRLQELGLIA